jgi:hypothetical protein
LAVAVDISVSVSPSIGIDSLFCSHAVPCKTIAYAMHTRHATTLLLLNETFFEPSIHINTSIIVSGLQGMTVFDCSGRAGPAFVAINASIAVSGITFRNCVNAHVSKGVGGALSAELSAVTISNCTFINNTAQYGGAIGVTSGTLVVFSSLFQNNSATCLTNSSNCSSWGGAISADDTFSVQLSRNQFDNNFVNIQQPAVRDAESQAAAGGGCVSVLYNNNVSSSFVSMYQNLFFKCTIQMVGLNDRVTTSGFQYGNSFGGAVSLYYGFRSALSLAVHASVFSFLDNVCRSSGITSRLGSAGNSYGGCLSVYAGAWTVSSFSGVGTGPVVVNGLHLNVSRNSIVNCSASIHKEALYTGGSNAYGGGISLVIGSYLYNRANGVISGATSAINCLYTISLNSISGCAAISSGVESIGASTYGGGISLVFGAYVYSRGSSTVLGSTEVSSSTYDLSGNTLADCSALTYSSSSSCRGENAYGGGVSFVVGCYSFSSESSSTISGYTAFSNSSFTFSTNTIISCSASSSSNSRADGANVYGGGLSVVTGAYSFSFGTSSSSSGTISSVLGNTETSNSSLRISSNSFMNCSASSTSKESRSHGANVYGGGMSIAFGVYSYGLFSGSIVDGGTAVFSSVYTITNNSLMFCSALASSVDGHLGSNTHGGAISVAIGAYSYHRFYFALGSHVIGTTEVSRSSFIILGNILTNCTVSTSTYPQPGSFSSASGSNSYGGGISFLVGAYSFSQVWHSSVSGNTSMSGINYSISKNIFTGCKASSATGGVSNGANVYGGCLSIVAGAYSYSIRIESSVRGSTQVNNTDFNISNNSFTDCKVSSYSGFDTVDDNAPFLSTNGLNTYGGCISLLLGVYSYSDRISSSVDGAITLSNSIYIMSFNALTNCYAVSAPSSPSDSGNPVVSSLPSITSYGANSYGGGLSVMIGAYSYCQTNMYTSESSSSVAGSITVSNTSFIISRSIFTGCHAQSSPGSTSNGASTYGGGMSFLLGAYSYSQGRSSIIGDIIVSAFNLEISDTSMSGCGSFSRSSSFSSDSQSFGGAVSIMFEPYSYPKFYSSANRAVVWSSMVQISRSHFRDCFSSTKATSCSAGSSNAAGGALFVSIPNGLVTVSSSYFTNCSVEALCAVSLSQSFSLGGALSFFHVCNATIESTKVAHCTAKGAAQATNVFVSGGGVFVQALKVLTVKNSSISFCRVVDAFSTLLQSGGGALGAHNMTSVEIADSHFHSNSDSSSTGVVFVQQLTEAYTLLNITGGSVLSMSSSINSVLPALKFSCGMNCSVEQQKRMQLSVLSSTLLAQSETLKCRSAIVMSIPLWSSVLAQNSFVTCNFQGTEGLAVLVSNASDSQTILASCSPCETPFEIALTSTNLNLGEFSSIKQRNCCHALSLISGFSSSAQRCPFGIATCSTTVSVVPGFWAKFSANGSISDAVFCPSKYCGCQYSPSSFSNTSGCEIFPIFSPEFASKVDPLCINNRSGVLCGGCKEHFTQSLNGFSCISNDVCRSNLGWMWAVTALGFSVYSFFIVRKSLIKSSGLVMCVLFYGQMSSFTSIPPIIEAQTQNSAASWISQMTQFESVLSLFESTCYGPNMGAYDATLAKLSGPIIVAIVALAITVSVNKLQSLFVRFFRKHHAEVHISLDATAFNVLLLLFSSVIRVVLQLITCVDIKLHTEESSTVVFIDGTKECRGIEYQVLVAAASLLSLVPFLFFVGLKFEKISIHTRAILCSAYIDSKHYWIAMSLLFRFSITALSATVAPKIPSIAAMTQCVCTMCMLLLLVALRPYVHQRTFYMDVLCHVCLIIQFLLQCVARASESLGVSVTRDNELFYNTISNAARTIIVLRFVSMQHFSCDSLVLVLTFFYVQILSVCNLHFAALARRCAPSALRTYWQDGSW